jgi:hypothetical protein
MQTEGIMLVRRSGAAELSPGTKGNTVAVQFNRIFEEEEVLVNHCVLCPL